MITTKNLREDTVPVKLALQNFCLPLFNLFTLGLRYKSLSVCGGYVPYFAAVSKTLETEHI